MPRLSDGSPDERTKELEETETNPLADWLAGHIKQGNMEHTETRDGIAYYRILNREAVL